LKIDLIPYEPDLTVLGVAFARVESRRPDVGLTSRLKKSSTRSASGNRFCISKLRIGLRFPRAIAAYRGRIVTLRER